MAIFIRSISIFICLVIGLVSGSTTPFYGEFVGSLSTLSHQVSGEVYIVDENRIRIRNFVYDGLGPAGYFWVGEKGISSSSPDQSGALIPDENGRREKLGRYDNDDIVLTLPPSLTVHNIRWLSVWCERFAVNFGHVSFPSDLRVPRPTVVGQFSNSAERVSSGNVTVINVKTINVKSFTCDCSQSDTQLIGLLHSPTDAVVKFQQSNERSANLDTARRLAISLHVPAPNTVMDFDYISVYSFDSNVTLARIALPSPLLVPPNLNVSSTTYHGVSLGRLPTLAHRVTGDVYIIDSKHFLIKNFVYDGTAPAAYFWVGERGRANPTPDNATGIAVPDQTEASRLTRGYTDEDVIVTLPDRLNADQILWLSVWCIDFRMNFGHVTLPAEVQVPRPTVIGQVSDSVHGVSSGNIIALNSNAITVESFSCNCVLTGIHFAGGYNDDKLTTPKLLRLHTPYNNLDSASQMDIEVSIPGQRTVHDLQMLGVHSFRTNRTLALIVLSSTLLVPPYLSDGVFVTVPAEVMTTSRPSGAGPCTDHNVLLALFTTAILRIARCWV